MKKITLRVTYEIGDKIKHNGGVWKVVGYEHVKGRGIRYIVLAVKNGALEWLYLYDFELKSLV